MRYSGAMGRAWLVACGMVALSIGFACVEKREAVDPGAGGASATVDPGCPSAPPADGAPCSRQDTYCTYGNEPIPGCRPEATCDQGMWMVPAIACPPTANDCPSNPSTDTVDMCIQQNSVCPYTEGFLCDCFCVGGTGCAYRCTLPEAGCPLQAPNAGEACSSFMPGQECFYGDPCSFGAATRCENGFWTWFDDAGCS
jgi:hypothetical protein